MQRVKGSLNQPKIKTIHFSRCCFAKKHEGSSSFIFARFQRPPLCTEIKPRQSPGVEVWPKKSLKFTEFTLECSLNDKTERNESKIEKRAQFKVISSPVHVGDHSWDSVHTLPFLRCFLALRHVKMAATTTSVRR